MGQWVRAQGQVKVVAKIWKHALIVTSPPENAKLKTKNVFFDLNKKTCWIRKGFEQLSSSGDFRPKKGRPIAAVKGLSSQMTLKEHEGFISLKHLKILKLVLKFSKFAFKFNLMNIKQW